MSNKTITIQQGTGDDALEMTVQVTQEELDKMEEIRSKDPSAWEGRGLDLVKAAKKELEEKQGKKKKSNPFILSLILVAIIGIILVVILFVINNTKNKSITTENSRANNNNNSIVSSYKPTTYNEQNLYTVHQKLLEHGFPGTYDEFFEYFDISMDNKRIVYGKLVRLGYPGSFKDFLEYVGCTMADWQSILSDFIATKEAKPNLTKEEWFEKFPEFNNDEKLLQAAFDYDATVKSGKYYDENELRSKFPEFWPDYLTNTRTNQNVNELYKGLCDNNLYNGSIDDFKSSLKCEPYRDALYHYLFEKEIYEGTYDGFHEEIGLSIATNSTIANHRRVLYDILSLYDYDLGDYETFSQKMNDEKKRRIFYDTVSEEYDIGSWEEFSAKVVDFLKNSDFSVVSSQLTTFSSKQYNFTYQYDNNEFNLVEKTNKNSHCVMKLQSPNDEVKSILVSVWENPEFSSSYDTDFISSCQSVDEAMGKVISSAVKTKVDGVNALKSELIISPMGKSYYAAIYRIIHKKRMYMLNIYIPMEEYNKDKSYGDKCANNFKFN